MTTIQIRIEEDLKNKATEIFNSLGLDISTAIRLFLKKSVIDGGIPFELKVSKTQIDGVYAINRMREKAESTGLSNMTLEEINSEIQSARQKNK